MKTSLPFYKVSEIDTVSLNLKSFMKYSYENLEQQMVDKHCTL